MSIELQVRIANIEKRIDAICFRLDRMALEMSEIRNGGRYSYVSARVEEKESKNPGEEEGKGILRKQTEDRKGNPQERATAQFRLPEKPDIEGIQAPRNAGTILERMTKGKP